VKGSAVAAQGSSVRSEARGARKSGAVRSHNRHAELLASAAQVFSWKGYGLTTVRDIAYASAMTPGSIYYHYPSKADLLFAVYRQAVRSAVAAFDRAASTGTHPWDKLERVVAAHLEIMLGKAPGGEAFAGVFVRMQPYDFPQEHRVALSALREGYELRFRELLATLPLRKGVDRSLLRLHLIGSLNHVPIWYRDKGRLRPAGIARRLVRMLREGTQVEASAQA
jgi:AcrR family transcriptional regulator